MLRQEQNVGSKNKKYLRAVGTLPVPHLTGRVMVFVLATDV
jgi:hypothetical protein